MGKLKIIETASALGAVAASAATVVGLIVASTALYRPEYLQKQKDLQALASARNLAFFAHRENLEEFRLATSGHHTSDSTQFETVLVGLNAIKFDQLPPHLTEAFVSIWSQTRRAQQMAAANSPVPIKTEGEVRLAARLLRPIDNELIRLGASFDAECKAVIEPPIPSSKDGCAPYR
jgi:hypothetical protein